MTEELKARLEAIRGEMLYCEQPEHNNGVNDGFDALLPIILEVAEVTHLELDCYDNSCRFAKRPMKGMRTNGGCQCGRQHPEKFVRAVLRARAALAKLGVKT